MSSCSHFSCSFSASWFSSVPAVRWASWWAVVINDRTLSLTLHIAPSSTRTIVAVGRQFSALYGVWARQVWTGRKAQFYPFHLHFALPLRVIPSEFRQDCWCQKTKPIATRATLSVDMFSRFDRTPTCDRRTDRYRYGRKTVAHTALGYRSAGKN